ncbi:MAG: nucleotidyltransferase domain-containing protein, partial [bacterium]
MLFYGVKQDAKQFGKQEIRNSLGAFFHTRDEVLLAYIFGSVAQSRQNKLSDVDIAILVKRDRLEKLNRQKFGYQVSIMTDLMGVLHRSDIDMVILNRATPLLAHEVVK